MFLTKNVTVEVGGMVKIAYILEGGGVYNLSEVKLFDITNKMDWQLCPN